VKDKHVETISEAKTTFIISLRQMFSGPARRLFYVPISRIDRSPGAGPEPGKQQTQTQEGERRVKNHLMNENKESSIQD
jgi:hypothetical protein